MFTRLRARFTRWRHLLATFIYFPAVHRAVDLYRADHQHGYVLASIECDCGRVFWKEQ